MNRLLLFVVFICLLFMKAKADIIIIDGKTYNLNSESPLNQYPFVKSIKEKLISYRTTAYDDPCDSYNAEWSIIKNELYLTNIYSCNDSKLQYKTDLKSLFKDNSILIENGKVKANWFTGDIWIAKGTQIYTYEMMMPIYDAETQLITLNGNINNIKDFVYPPLNAAFGNNDTDARTQFINSHINWSIIPNLKNQAKRVNIVFQSGKSGKPDKVSLFKPVEDKILSDEAIRVISLMPWNAYYRHGEIFKQPVLISVQFSEELRQKYSH